MTVGAVLFFVVIVATALTGRKGAGPKDIPVSETLTPPGTKPWERRLDNIGLWMVVAVVLIVIAYAPFFLGYLPPNMVSAGFSVW